MPVSEAGAPIFARRIAQRVACVAVRIREATGMPMTARTFRQAPSSMLRRHRLFTKFWSCERSMPAHPADVVMVRRSSAMMNFLLSPGFRKHVTAACRRRRQMSAISFPMLSADPCRGAGRKRLHSARAQSSSRHQPRTLSPPTEVSQIGYVKMRCQQAVSRKLPLGQGDNRSAAALLHPHAPGCFKRWRRLQPLLWPALFMRIPCRRSGRRLEANGFLCSFDRTVTHILTNANTAIRHGNSPKYWGQEKEVVSAYHPKHPRPVVNHLLLLPMVFANHHSAPAASPNERGISG
jgi:hypothetical protein